MRGLGRSEVPPQARSGSRVVPGLIRGVSLPLFAALLLAASAEFRSPQNRREGPHGARCGLHQVEDVEFKPSTIKKSWKEKNYTRQETTHMDLQTLISRKNVIVTILAVGYFIATAALMPTAGYAHVDDKMPSLSAVRDDMVKASMSALRAKTGKLGEPKIEGKDPLAGKDAPALYFGATKMNNSSDVVDKVVKENGGAATLFVKTGDGYVRVATTMRKDDGSSAACTIVQGSPRYQPRRALRVSLGKREAISAVPSQQIRAISIA
jgi:hypothetical protein